MDVLSNTFPEKDKYVQQLFLCLQYATLMLFLRKQKKKVTFDTLNCSKCINGGCLRGKRFKLYKPKGCARIWGISAILRQISTSNNKVYLGGDTLMLNINNKDYDDNLDKVTKRRWDEAFTQHQNTEIAPLPPVDTIDSSDPAAPLATDDTAALHQEEGD